MNIKTQRKRKALSIEGAWYLRKEKKKDFSLSTPKQDDHTHHARFLMCEK